mgnify:CR=1 FL=1
MMKIIFEKHLKEIVLEVEKKVDESGSDLLSLVKFIRKNNCNRESKKTENKQFK